jgi:catechol 2,3-dioxygenase
VDIGHVHLKVADLERALGFWHGVLGFDIMQRLGDQAAFLSAGGYHHHIGLNTWESLGGSAPPPGTTGLYHVAVRYPDRRALAGALRRVLDAGVALDGASDHGVSEALYLRDPDGSYRKASSMRSLYQGVQSDFLAHPRRRLASPTMMPRRASRPL